MGTVPVMLSSTRFVVMSLAMRSGNRKILTRRIIVKRMKSTRLKTNIMVESIPSPEN